MSITTGRRPSTQQKTPLSSSRIQVPRGWSSSPFESILTGPFIGCQAYSYRPSGLWPPSLIKTWPGAWNGHGSKSGMAYFSASPSSTSVLSVGIGLGLLPSQLPVYGKVAVRDEREEDGCLILRQPGARRDEHRIGLAQLPAPRSARSARSCVSPRRRTCRGPRRAGAPRRSATSTTSWVREAAAYSLCSTIPMRRTGSATSS